MNHIPTSQPQLYTRSFILLCLAHLLYALGFWLFVILPLFLKSLGADKSEIGCIMGTLMLSAFLLRPVIGVQLDKRGRRLLLIIGASIQVVACLLYLTVHEIGIWIYLIRVLHGIGAGTMFSAFLAFVSDLVPAERRTEGLSIWGLWGLLPMAFGPGIGEILVFHVGYQGLFWGAFFFCFSSLLVILLIPDSMERRTHPRKPVKFFRTALQKPLLSIWIVALIFGMALSSYMSFIALYIESMGLRIGFFFYFYAAAAVLIRFVGAKLPDRYDIRRVLIVTLGFYLLGLIMIAQARSGWHFAVAGLLCGLAHGYLFPILNSLAVQRCKANERGIVVTAYAAFLDLGAFIGAPVLGLLAEVKDFHFMYRITAVMILIAIIQFVLFDRKLQGD